MTLLLGHFRFDGNSRYVMDVSSKLIFIIQFYYSHVKKDLPNNLWNPLSEKVCDVANIQGECLK